MDLHRVLLLILNIALILICIQFAFVQTDAKRLQRTISSSRVEVGPEPFKRFKRSPQSAEKDLFGENDSEEYPIENPGDASSPTDLLGGNTTTVVRTLSSDSDLQWDLEAALIPSNIGELYIPKDYNKLEIPKPSAMMEDGVKGTIPLLVQVYLSIRSVFEVDEANEEISLEMDFVVEWLDGVLYNSVIEENRKKQGQAEFNDEDFEQKTLDPVFLKKIWRPDLYFEGLVDVIQPTVISRPARLQFSRGGFISFCTRMIIKLDCELDFKYYPADTQKCDVVFRSYSYNSTDFQLVWRKPRGAYLLYRSDDNFDISIGLLRRYTLMSNLAEDTSNNETYDTLQFTVFARRKLSYQLVQTYIPSTLYIAITWLCFMIPRKMIEARMAISMTTLLTLTAMFGAVRDSTPVVSYIKAIDIWMVSNIAFVFLTLFEFAVLLWTESAKNEDEQQGNKKKSESDEEFDDKNTQEDLNNVKIQRPTTCGQKIRNVFLVRCTIIIEFVETYAFVLILSIFALFNVFYWSWLLISSGYYYKWHVDPLHNSGAGIGNQQQRDENFTERILAELDIFGDNYEE